MSFEYLLPSSILYLTAHLCVVILPQSSAPLDVILLDTWIAIRLQNTIKINKNPTFFRFNLFEVIQDIYLERNLPRILPLQVPFNIKLNGGFSSGSRLIIWFVNKELLLQSHHHVLQTYAFLNHSTAQISSRSDIDTQLYFCQTWSTKFRQAVCFYIGYMSVTRR